MDMNLRNTALAAGAIAVLGAGLALAQPAPQGAPEQSGPAQGYQGYQGPPPGYQGGYQGNHAMWHHHHHGVLALIREEVNAGRISKKEGSLLERKIREIHAERRAERQAREYGERGAPPAQAQ